MWMKILSLDASTKSSGYAIFNEQKLESYGCITASSTDLIKRINKMITELEQILIKEKVDKIILEEVRPEQGLQNIKTHKALMYLQAAIAFLIHERFNTIEVEYTYPNEWRAACGIHTGRGVKRETLKSADIKFVKENFGITVNDDEADAIGIGYAYVNKLSNEINWE
jgi:Holliday junction resolvasome RuvABC endonuclease subunit